MQHFYAEPYISITDFTHPDQVRRIAAIPYDWDIAAAYYERAVRYFGYP